MPEKKNSRDGTFLSCNFADCRFVVTLAILRSLNYADSEECAELRIQLADVISRCRHLLSTASGQGKQANLPPELVQLCASMLLNLEDLTFFKTGALHSSSQISAKRFLSSSPTSAANL